MISYDQEIILPAFGITLQPVIQPWCICKSFGSYTCDRIRDRNIFQFPQYGYPHTLRRYAEIAENLGLGGNTDEEKLENIIKAIDELKEKIGIKKTIRDYGVDEQEFLSKLDEMSKQAFDDQCTGANPRYPLIEEIKQMYLEAYYGGER